MKSADVTAPTLFHSCPRFAMAAPLLLWDDCSCQEDRTMARSIGFPWLNNLLWGLLYAVIFYP